MRFNLVELQDLKVGNFFSGDYIFSEYLKILDDFNGLISLKRQAFIRDKDARRLFMKRDVEALFCKGRDLLESFAFANWPENINELYEIKQHSDILLRDILSDVVDFDDAALELANDINDHISELQSNATGFTEIYQSGRSGGFLHGLMAAATAVADQIKIDSHSAELHSRIDQKISPIFDHLRSSFETAFGGLYDFYAGIFGINEFDFLKQSKSRSVHFFEKLKTENSISSKTALMNASVDAFPFINRDWVVQCESLGLTQGGLQKVLSRPVFLINDERVVKAVNFDLIMESDAKIIELS